MYDEGNIIKNANGSEFTYLDNCDFGASPEPYFMHIEPYGLSVFYIEQAATNNIMVTGETGENRLLVL